jgi:hypothetical protein
LGQPARAGEEIGIRLSRWFSPLIPDNYRPIEAKRVARALLAAMRTAQGRRVMLSGEMQRA